MVYSLITYFEKFLPLDEQEISFLKSVFKESKSEGGNSYFRKEIFADLTHLS